MGNAKAFKSGRQFAALARVGATTNPAPANEVRLLGISKRGDKNIFLRCWDPRRSIGADAQQIAARVAEGELVKRRPKNVAVVAMARQEMARTIWALLAHERAYQSGYVSPTRLEAWIHDRLTANKGSHAKRLRKDYNV